MNYLGFPGLKPHPVQGVIVAPTKRHGCTEIPAKRL